MTALNVSQPQVTLNIVAAQTTVSNAEQRVLIVGQKTSAGSATSGALYTNIQNDGSWDTLFGANSMLAGMIREFRRINRDVNIDAIPLSDNGSGVAAAGEVAFSGTATAAGTLLVSIGSEVQHTYSIAVASGDTATAIGDALEAAVLADTRAPFTAANTTGTVALTFDNAGPEGNGQPIKVSGTVAGVTVALTAFASGATAPTLTDIFDVVGDERYQTIVWPYGYGVATVKTFIDDRFNVGNNVLDGVAVMTASDTYANLITAGDAQNSQSLVILGNKPLTNDDHVGGATVELTYVLTARFAAVRSLRLNAGSSIANIVSASAGSRDSIGGPAIASLPYANTLLPNTAIAGIGKGWTAAEVSDLKDSGISTFGPNRARSAVILGEIVTTYKTDAAGNPDVSFKYLNYVDTISNVREYFFNNMKSRYAQTRLTADDAPVTGGRSITKASSIAADLDGWYADLAGPDYVLTQAGETALQYFRDNRTVLTSLDTGLVTVVMQTPIVTQLRTIQGSVQIAFSVDTTTAAA